MDNIFNSELIKKHDKTHARVTKISTPHGELLTPCFMPVGTRAFVNHMTPTDLDNALSQIILGGNTYHMLVAPGTDIILRAGGMHQFMGWHKPMLTDSGGFQVYSLSENSQICTINERGAHFKHPITGKVVHMTPTVSIETQKIIGADIIMAFDQCTPESGGREAAIAAMARTHRWLIESKEAHERQPCSPYGFKQALFGIIQGGTQRDLREESAEYIVNMDLDGVAIGGEVIGFDMAKTIEVISWIRPILPENKTRYTMGVGAKPQDLLDVVAAGIDIFDCVSPTRIARHGALYCGQIVEHEGWLKWDSTEDKGRILIKKAMYATDERPIMPGCQCYTCKHFSRAYLHFLFREKFVAYGNLACIHNVHVMNETCRHMREFILKQTD